MLEAIDGNNITPPNKPCPCCGKKNLGSPDSLIECYLSRGCTVSACVRALIAAGKDKDEKAGDDTFHWKDATVPGWDFAKEYQDLPRCRNDSEFGFIEAMLLSM